MAEIKSCDCKHEYQDKTYGKGLRVHNRTGAVKKEEGKNASAGSYRCTVCGKNRS